MPVSFLSPAQRDSYGQYLGDPSTQELARYFHLDDSDHTQIVEKRGDANRLGFALQLTTVRFVGTFLDDPTAVPPAVLATMSRQLGIDTTTDLTELSRRQVALRSCRTNPDGTWVSRPRGSRGRVWPHAMALRTVLDGHRTSERTVRSGDDLDARPQGVVAGRDDAGALRGQAAAPRRRARVARAGERHQSATAAPPRRSVARAR